MTKLIHLKKVSSFLLALIVCPSFSTATDLPPEEIARRAHEAEHGPARRQDYNLDVSKLTKVVKEVLKANAHIDASTLDQLELSGKNGPSPKELLPGQSDRFGGEVNADSLKDPEGKILTLDSFRTRVRLIWEANGKTKLFLSVENWNRLYEAMFIMCKPIDELTAKICGRDKEIESRPYNTRKDAFNLSTHFGGYFPPGRKGVKPKPAGDPKSWPLAKIAWMNREDENLVLDLAKTLWQAQEVSSRVVKLQNTIRKEKGEQCPQVITVNLKTKTVVTENGPCVIQRRVLKPDSEPAYK